MASDRNRQAGWKRSYQHRAEFFRRGWATPGNKVLVEDLRVPVLLLCKKIGNTEEDFTASPTPLLNAECRNWDLAGAGGNDKVSAKRVILTSAFDNVTGQDQQICVAEVLDKELVDVARLVEKGGLIFQAFFHDGIVGKRRFLGCGDEPGSEILRRVGWASAWWWRAVSVIMSRLYGS